jgi:phosphoesterase RecJ-like protein
VASVLKEEVDGTIRVSLRSLGAVDVRRIAEAHGGGGHRFAAGFSSELDLDTVVARIRAAL